MKQRENVQRIKQTLTILRERFPYKGALDLGTDFQMLVAVVLSARTKDEQVLRVLPNLFSVYGTIERMAHATPEEVGRYISTIGLYKSKARYLVALAQKLEQEFGGMVPQTMQELTALPGVGRKTASVLLASRFSTPAIAVDTHVFRIVKRLGWAKGANVQTVERELLRAVPLEDQATINTVMVPFGRAICAPTPRCYACPVREMCAFSKKNLTPPSDADDKIERAQKTAETLEKLRTHVAYELS